MLDSNTKKRIDDCRDILVGKLPIPKSQIDQITLALIYKFMDDMDQQSKDFGGVASFFTGSFEKYSWSSIMSSQIGANEMLKLYSEGIEGMSENESIQPLFRSIFKDAYLPYRDPETLKMFLKKINEFSYDHSEKLGDAFEYLLSVMGSQGDAGQFRTPRHIIDFMVDITSPKKDETILDPSCGTSGFLISAYKKIISDNTKDRPGDLLSSMEKKKLLGNVSGYNISPDMIRLSLANLFLHGFNEDNLKIFEYDTLTSLDRWNEYYDVILANPPFMTPKGGIRPHNRFSIKSNRAEGLFVNYIMEHLTPKGRAAIVVPEGIIFQLGSAYKDLRKSLIEKSLIGVISLPSGVFNPYSAVKTSILILDRELSQKTDKIFFGKVENDGYDLGAQRREIDKNDLPKIKEGILEYIKNIKDGDYVDNSNLKYLSKADILATSDLGLAFDRYLKKDIVTNYEVFDLIDLIDIQKAKKINSKEIKEKAKYPVIDQSQEFISGYSNEKNYLNEFTHPVIIFGDHTLTFKYVDFSFVGAGDGIKVISTKDPIDTKFLYYLLNNYEFDSLGYSRHYKLLKDLKIPVPSLEIQMEIVEELDQYQKVIEATKQVVDNYKPHIDIDKNSTPFKFESAPILIIDGDRGKNYPKKEDFFEDGHCLFLNTSNVTKHGFSNKKLQFITKEKDLSLRKGKLQKDDVVLTTRGTLGNSFHFSDLIKYPEIRINSGMVILRPEKDKILPKFLHLFLISQNFKSQIMKHKSGSAQPQLPISTLKNLEIFIPSIEIQDQIVKKLEEERLIVEGNKKLIEIYTQKTEDRINKIWEA